MREGILGVFPIMGDGSESVSLATAAISHRVMEDAEVVTAAAEVVMSWDEMQQILNDELGGRSVQSVAQCEGEVQAAEVTVATAVTAAAVLNTEENSEAVRIGAGCMTGNRQKQRTKEDNFQEVDSTHG